VLRDVACEVEDERAVLPWRGAKRAADHLKVKPHALRRAEEDRRADRRNVEALAEHAAIRDDLRVAGAEPGDGRAPFRRRGLAVEVGRAHTRLAEASGDRLGMLDVDAEGDGGSAGAETPVFLDRGADHDAVHRGANVLGRVVAGANAGAREVGPMRRRVDHESGQPAGGDQRRRGRALDHRVERLAEAAPVEAFGRRGHAEDMRLRLSGGYGGP
jgi:hypothetical protein